MDANAHFSNDMNYRELADKARYLKKDKEVQEITSGVMSDIVEEFDNGSVMVYK